MPTTAATLRTYTIGPYTLVDELEPEGHSRVFQATDPARGGVVKIRVLPGRLWENPERKARFLREFRKAALLRHPHIAAIHETGDVDGSVYIASEHVDGATLAQFLAGEPMNMAGIARAGVALAEALAYAHENGVLHRDLEAANVQLSASGEPKLLNFGLPRVRTEGLGGDGLAIPILGTPSAMSPEQALGRPVDARSEVFSLGSLLYEMACGRPAFAGATARDTMDAVIEATPELLDALRPDLPDDLAMIVEKAMQKDPERRYRDMAQLAADLRTFQRRVDSLLAGSGAGRRLAWPLLGAGALLLLGLLLWLVL